MTKGRFLSGTRLRVFVTTLFVFVLLVASTALAVKPGEWPLNAKARQALVDGNLAEAKPLFEMALLANPNDRITWYNYACALALAGDGCEAITALDNACETGYWDFEWTVQDSDLVTLFEREDFIKVVDKMKVFQAEQDSIDAANPTYYVPQTMMGHYELTLPEDYDAASGKKHPLIVLLHGRGEGCQGIHRLPNKLTVKDAIYVQPFAPYPLPGQRTTWEYWPHAMRQAGDDEGILQAMKLTTAWHRELIKDIAKHANIDKKNVFVIGFSQGAGMTYATACDNADLFAGAAALSGWLPEQYRDGKTLAKIAKKKMPFFIGHGTLDHVENAEEGKEMLEAAGINVTLKTYEVQHTMPDEEMVDLTEWIESHMR